MATSEPQLQSIQIVQETLIAAAPQIAFDAILAELGPEGAMPDGTAFPLKLEPWPGGRWFRDLGNNAGHFWGTVQVIKPPTLIELCGPLFMSFAATSHVQYRLAAEGQGTRLKFIHRAIGQIPAEFRESMTQGWAFKIDHVKQIAERNAAGR